MIGCGHLRRKQLEEEDGRDSIKTLFTESMFLPTLLFFLFSLLKKSNVLFGRRDVFSELVPSVDLLQTWHLKLKTFRPERFPIQMS